MFPLIQIQKCSRLPDRLIFRRMGNKAGNTVANYYTGPDRNRSDETFADIKVLSFYLNDEIALTDSIDLI